VRLRESIIGIQIEAALKVSRNRTSPVKLRMPRVIGCVYNAFTNATPEMVVKWIEKIVVCIE
jgi:hypothetical protein